MHASVPLASGPDQRESGLIIRLLGQPAAYYHNRPLTIPRRIVRGILFRLACDPEPLSRDRLCLLFWPEEDQTTARRNLSHHLTHLRRALPLAEILITAEDAVALDSSRLWCDARTFECLSKSPPEGGEALEATIGLYRGSFLEGFSFPHNAEFDQWVSMKRGSLDRLFLDTLRKLIDHHASGGDVHKAIAFAQRYLELDDLAEEIHRQLMVLYERVGKRSAALRQYELCAAALERELGVTPLPETRATYQLILNGAPPLATPVINVEPPDLPGIDIPLFGRIEAMHKLEEIFQWVRAGQGTFVLISGEAGIGKSRLLQALATDYQKRARFLFGSGHLGEHNTPYHPLVEALCQPVRVHATGLSPIWLAELSRLFPELRRLEELPPQLTVEPEEARLRLFEALYRFVEVTFSTESPTILCLDDLHWADAATLDWLIYLGRKISRARGQYILVTGTYRDEDSERLSDLRAALTRSGNLVQLKLGGLDRRAVIEILNHISGSLPGVGQLADNLLKATGGNPFFLLEILRAFIETGRTLEELSNLEELPLPENIRAAVRLRLQRLTPIARQVLESASILGTSFNYEEVHLTAGREEAEIVDGLDEMVARQLVAAHHTTYRFCHDLTRWAVEADLSPVRRQLLHRRAALALEHLKPDAKTTLAWHFDAGDQPEKALQYYHQAAQQAEALFAWQEAERHHVKILQLLDRVDPDCKQPDCLERRGRVLATRAHLCFLQGRLAERDADLEQLATLAERSSNDDLRLQVFVQQTRYLNLDGCYSAAIKAARQGLALAKRLRDTPARCRLLAQVGFGHYFLGKPRQALGALESALELAGGEAAPETRGRILHILGYVYFHVGDYPRSLDCQQEAYAYHQQVGDANRVAWDGLDIGAVYLELGKTEVAKRFLEEHLSLARDIGSRPAEAYGLNQLGSWNLHQGDFTSARACFQASLAIQKELNNEHGCVAAELGLGLASYHLGCLEEAREHLERAVHRAHAIGHRRRLAETLIGLGLVEHADGQTAAARRCLREALAKARESECRESLAVGLAALGRVERGAHYPTDALEHAREAIGIAQEAALPVCEMWGNIETGLALLDLDDPMAAQVYTRRAIELLPHAHQGWIGGEEAQRAHALVLRTLHQTQAAEQHELCANQIVQAKADFILDPLQRHRFLTKRRYP